MDKQSFLLNSKSKRLISTAEFAKKWVNMTRFLADLFLWEMRGCQSPKIPSFTLHLTTPYMG